MLHLKQETAMKKNRFIFLFFAFLFVSCNSHDYKKYNEYENTNAATGEDSGSSSDGLIIVESFDNSASYNTNINNSIIKRKQEYKFLFPLEYDNIYNYSDRYVLLKKGDKGLVVKKESKEQIFIFSLSDYAIVDIYNETMCFRSNKTSKYGLMSIDGTILTEPVYELPLTFYDDLAVTKLDNEYCFINTNGDIVIKDLPYEFFCPFNEGFAAVGRGDQYWFINKKGEEVSGPHKMLDGEVFLRTFAYMQCSDGYAAFFENSEDAPYDAYAGQVYWGYMNMNGEATIPAQYLSVRPFSEGLAAVKTKSEEWVYIDKEGNEIMKASPSDFSNGIAYFEGKFIDKNGKIICEIPTGYEVDFTHEHGFKSFAYGMVNVSKREDMHFIDAIMDETGKIILESEDFEEIEILYDDLLSVKIDSKWGIIQL
jgi:hypothetical protein